MKRVFWIVACIGWGHGAVADMYSQLQSVYDTNPVIAGAAASVGAAAADADLARSGYLPAIGLSGGVNLAHSEILGQDYDYTPTQFGAQFEQSVFAGGAIIGRIKAADAMHASQVALFYSTQQDVFLSAINAYINVLNSSAVLELNKNNRRVLDEYYAFVSNRVDVGMLTRTDADQAAARRAAAEYSVSQSQSQYDNDIETFRRIYGGVPAEFKDVSLYRVHDLFPANLSAATEYALNTHPALRALRAQEDAARADIAVARATRLPSIDVRGSLIQADDVPILDRVRDGRIGVYLKIPLFDRGVSGAKMERARFTLDGIGSQIENVRRTIIENLTTAWNVYDAQTTAIDAARASVSANKAALSGVRDAQARGRRTVLDVLNAEQELLNSRVSLTRAEHAQISAYFAILAAMGYLTAENLGLTTD